MQFKTKEGSIRIYQYANTNQLKLSTNHEFFNTERIIVEVGDGFVMFSKPDSTYEGRSYSMVANKKGNGWMSTITNELLKDGVYDIDTEDSDIDSVVVYY